MDDCLKLTTYFGERQRTDRRFLADELLDLYGRRQVATSIVLRGIMGFGLRHHLRTDQLLTLSEDPPMAVVAVDTRARIDALLPDVLALKRRGLLTLERARIVRSGEGAVELPPELRAAAKLTIYVGRHERSAGVPAHVAVCDLLHRRGLAGASVLLGVDGTAGGARERARFVGRNRDVPTMIIAVGSGESIAGALPDVEALLDRPLLTVERIRLCKRDGVLLDRPHALPGTDEHGLGLWQKLMIYTTESAKYRGRPIHRAIVNRLRETGAARGATSLRGLWGFHGDHPPQGDRLLQTSRHVPVTTIVVDTPENIARAFDVVDELTAEHGLVTSEMVPAQLTLDEDARHGGLRLARHDY